MSKNSSTVCLQVFPSNEKIENINDQYWTLRAEEVSSSQSLFLNVYLCNWVCAYMHIFK